MASKQVLILNTFADLTIYKAGVSTAIGSIAAGDKEVAFFDSRYLTPDLDSKEIKRAVKNVYSAGTAAVQTVLLPGIGADGTFWIQLQNTSRGTANIPKKNFTDVTMAAVVARINAEGLLASSFFFGFTASLSTSTVTITAPINTTFRIAAMPGSTITRTTEPVFAYGRAVDVSDLESRALPYQGPANKVGFPVKAPVSRVVAGGTYDVIVLKAYPATAAKTHTGGLKTEELDIYIAVNKTMVTSNQTVDTILTMITLLT